MFDKGVWYGEKQEDEFSVITEGEVWVNGLKKWAAVDGVPEDLIEIGEIDAFVEKEGVFEGAGDKKCERGGAGEEPEEVRLVAQEGAEFFADGGHI